MLTPVGFVGLGNAGSALATALSENMPLLGHDANAARREVVASLDLEWIDSVSDMGTQAKAVVLSLPKPEISKAVTAELLAGDPWPELIIETSTVPPNVAKELHAMCQAAHVSFVDAAIAGGVAGMAAGTTTFLVGGDEADVAKARPILAAMSETIMHLGAIGNGMGAKVVNNAVMHAVMVVLIEAGAMATKSGIPMQIPGRHPQARRGPDTAAHPPGAGTHDGEPLRGRHVRVQCA